MIDKYIYLLIFLFFLNNIYLWSSPADDSEQEKNLAKADKLLRNSSQGKNFWIAIPPNEIEYFSYAREKAIEIYVTSKVNTTVTLEVPSTGRKITKTVNAYSITVFTSQDGEASFNWEIRDFERVLKKGIHITSPDPISVHVINSRNTTTDGYLAIPVESWGKNYIHVSFWDNFERDRYEEGNKRGGGLVVVAAEDNTNCRIILRGKGKSEAGTTEGRSIGDTIDIKLNSGEIYSVMGDGTTTGKFDLSGSEVISDKKIGLISFHLRAIIPANFYDQGRDYLVEMLPPVNTWGKSYVSLEFKRQDYGDYFRITAAENNTRWHVVYYDTLGGRKIGEYSGVLDERGDFFDIGSDYPLEMTSIRGTSVWSADKPVLVTQYAYSADWDNSDSYDPFMVFVVPVEQYVRTAVVQTPYIDFDSFKHHYINIIAIGDSTDDNSRLLKSIELDGSPLWNIYPDLLKNRIPGTDLYWARIEIDTGAHKLDADTDFGGYLYGIGYYNSYGWPGAIGFENLIEVKDTLPPETLISQDCGIYSINISETRNGNPTDNPRQEDKGIKLVELLPGSMNYELEIDSSIVFDSIVPVYTYGCMARVSDKDKPGIAYICITDYAGNKSYDTLRFSPDMLPIVTFKLNKTNEYTSQLPGSLIPVSLDISCLDWNKAGINEFEYSFIYPARSLDYMYDISRGSGLDETWKIEARQKWINDSITIMTITGKGETLIKNDLNLASFQMRTFLQPSSNILLSLNKIFTNNYGCVRAQTDFSNINIEINSCAFNLRQVRFGLYDYGFDEINPNPVDGDGVIHADFRLGIGADTRIIISNTIGETVIYKDYGFKASGIHQESIDVNGLGSGVYYIRLVSGPFSQTHSFTLVK